MNVIHPENTRGKQSFVIVEEIIDDERKESDLKKQFQVLCCNAEMVDKQQKALQRKLESFKLAIVDLNNRNLTADHGSWHKAAESMSRQMKVLQIERRNLQKSIIDVKLEMSMASSLYVTTVIKNTKKVTVLKDDNKRKHEKDRHLKAQMLSDFKTLFESEKFCDVSLHVNGHEFHAHKAVLVARSPVFAAMFEHEMVEKNENKVEITDVDPEVFKEMLCYIYTETAPNLSKLALDLFVAADKYALLKLKWMCEKALCSAFTVENVSDVLLLADRHGADALTSEACDFIIYNGEKVMETDGWKSLMVQDPQLVSKVLKMLFAELKPSAKRLRPS